MSADSAPATDVRRRSRAVIHVAAAAGIAALLLTPVPGRFAAPWIGSLQDLAHVPLLAFVAGLVQRASGAANLIAAAAALGVAAAAELLQPLVGRSASVGDVMRGAFGVALFLGWRLAARRPSGWRRGAARTLAVAVGTAIPVAAAWPTLRDAVDARRAFPILADFSSPRQARRWTEAGCRLAFPDAAQGSGGARLECDPAVPEPALILFPVRRDWSAFDALLVDFTVVGDALPITLSVRDGRRVEPPRRRFDLAATYAAGRHVVRIDLGALARGGGDVSPVDVAAVQSVHVIVGGGTAPPGTLQLHRLWLE